MPCQTHGVNTATKDAGIQNIQYTREKKGDGCSKDPEID